MKVKTLKEAREFYDLIRSGKILPTLSYEEKQIVALPANLTP